MEFPTDLAPGSLVAFLDDTDRRLLLDAGTYRAFRADEVLLRQGDPTDHVLVLLAGWVRVSTSTVDGRDALVAFRGPGDVLGELAALNGWVRTATTRTIQEVRAVQLRSEAFRRLVESRPTVALALIGQLSSRLREAEAARSDLATLDVVRRVAVYLLSLVESHGVRRPEGVTFGVPLTQQDVAERVGASLRAVARAFAVLRKRGIVTRVGRRIVIARPDVLRAFTANPPKGT
jgi:CRP/FNR family cyclic AMP-dependent transcriptional regulator